MGSVLQGLMRQMGVYQMQSGVEADRHCPVAVKRSGCVNMLQKPQIFGGLLHVGGKRGHRKRVI